MSIVEATKYDDDAFWERLGERLGAGALGRVHFIEPPDPREVVRTGWEKQPGRSLWDQLRDLD